MSWARTQVSTTGALGRRNGLHRVSHGGGSSGFNSRLEMLPEHGVGIIILTNRAVRRRFLEVLFDLEHKASAKLHNSLQMAADLRAIELARIAEADPAWFDRLVGTLEAPGLGHIELLRNQGDATIDAGEWTARVGKKTRRDGTHALVVTNAPTLPLADFELVPRTQDGRTVLIAVDRQHTYIFERK